MILFKSSKIYLKPFKYRKLVNRLRGTKKFCLVTLHNNVYNVIKYILEGETDGS